MLLAIAQITAFNEVLEFASAETTGRIGKLERPKKVRGLLEIGANSENFVDQILHADNTV